MSAVLDRRTAWSSFWESGPLHSLPGSLDDNLAGPVAEFWQQQLAPLTNDQQVVDIGTGNGALPRLALDLLGENCPTIHAVDLSSVRPAWHQPDTTPSHQRVHFHAGIACEQLPLADNSQDAAISQFALEYSDLDRSLPEISRVLKPTARLALVMHHRDSQLMRVAAAEIEQLAALLADDGFIACARQVLPFFARIAHGQGTQVMNDPQAALHRQAFNQAADTLLQIRQRHPLGGCIATSMTLIGDLIKRTAQGVSPLDDALAWLETHHTQLQQALLRNRELVDCALDQRALEKMATLLEQAGFTIHIQAPLRHAGFLLGWQLAAVRIH